MNLKYFILGACLSVITTSSFSATGLGNSFTKSYYQIPIKQAANQSFSIQTINQSNGTVIREFNDTNGKVFAISWKGPFMPDMQELLGNYFTNYINNSQPSHDHTHLNIENGDLVMQNKGHMRAFSGNAYVKTLLPTNFVLSNLN